MAARDPETGRVAEALRQAMEDRGISRTELADGIEKITGTRPNPQWIHRRMTGEVWLTELKPSAEPSPELKIIAQALVGTDKNGYADRLAEALAEAAETVRI